MNDHLAAVSFSLHELPATSKQQRSYKRFSWFPKSPQGGKSVISNSSDYDNFFVIKQEDDSYTKLAIQTLRSNRLLRLLVYIVLFTVMFKIMVSIEAHKIEAASIRASKAQKLVNSYVIPLSLPFSLTSSAGDQSLDPSVTTTTGEGTMVVSTVKEAGITATVSHSSPLSRNTTTLAQSSSKTRNDTIVHQKIGHQSSQQENKPQKSQESQLQHPPQQIDRKNAQANLLDLSQKSGDNSSLPSPKFLLSESDISGLQKYYQQLIESLKPHLDVLTSLSPISLSYDFYGQPQKQTDTNQPESQQASGNLTLTSPIILKGSKREQWEARFRDSKMLSSADRKLCMLLTEISYKFDPNSTLFEGDLVQEAFEQALAIASKLVDLESADKFAIDALKSQAIFGDCDKQVEGSLFKTDAELENEMDVDHHTPLYGAWCVLRGVAKSTAKTMYINQVHHFLEERLSHIRNDLIQKIKKQKQQQIENSLRTNATIENSSGNHTTDVQQFQNKVTESKTATETASDKSPEEDNKIEEEERLVQMPSEFLLAVHNLFEISENINPHDLRYMKALEMQTIYGNCDTKAKHVSIDKETPQWGAWCVLKGMDSSEAMKNFMVRATAIIESVKESRSSESQQY